MRFYQKTISPAANDADGICASQTATGGGVQSLTIAGALASGGVATLDSTGRQVSITSTGNLSSVTFNVSGKVQNNWTVTESVTGPNNSTVYTTNYFSTVSGVTVSTNVTSAVTVGTSGGRVATPWLPLNRYCTPFNTSFGVKSTSANNTYTVQHTLANLQQATGNLDDTNITIHNHEDIASKTDLTNDGNYAFPISAMRLVSTNTTTGSLGSLTLEAMQQEG